MSEQQELEAELYEICSKALREAGARQLTDDEIGALRYLANVYDALPTRQSAQWDGSGEPF